MSSFKEILKEGNLTDFRMDKFVKNRFLLSCTKFLPIISFLLANIGVIIIFEYFFHLINIFGYWSFGIYFVGLFFSIVVLKPYIVLNFKQDKSNKGSDLETKTSNKKLENETHFPRIGRINSSIIILRSFFFNILNDAFIVVVFWIMCFFIFYLFLKFCFFCEFPFIISA